MTAHATMRIMRIMHGHRTTDTRCLLDGASIGAVPRVLPHIRQRHIGLWPRLRLQPAAEVALDLLPREHIFRRDQGDGYPLAVHAPRAPDAMGEQFGGLWQLVVDNLINGHDIEAARRYI